MGLKSITMGRRHRKQEASQMIREIEKVLELTSEGYIFSDYEPELAANLIPGSGIFPTGRVKSQISLRDILSKINEIIDQVNAQAKLVEEMLPIYRRIEAIGSRQDPIAAPSDSVLNLDHTLRELISITNQLIGKDCDQTNG